MKLKRPSGNIELKTNSDDELPDRNSTLYRENNIISKYITEIFQNVQIFVYAKGTLWCI